MKIPEMAKAVGNIDHDLISDAADRKTGGKKKSFTFVKWSAAVAACLAAVIVASVLIIPKFKDNNTVSVGGIYRNYKAYVASRSDETGMFEFPWEYKLTYEKFPVVTCGGYEYQARGEQIDETLLGESVGKGTSTGIDYYTGKTYTQSFDVRKIDGVSEKNLVAVGTDEGYYVYSNFEAKAPETFGELIDTYDLTKTLPLTKFSVIRDGNNTKGNYMLDDDGYIWSILSECTSAKLCGGVDFSKKNYLSFTATSDSLGVYKNVFYITEDGYIRTNALDFDYVYNIGKDASDRIISYAMKNAAKVKAEPYQYTLGGTVTEIGDGYILVDDSVLCKDKNDGMVFKVLTTDPRVSRYIECGLVNVGDTVLVRFREKITAGGDNTVKGAVSICRGTVVDGDMLVNE